MQFVSHVIAN